ncbi:Metal-dependent hydrolase YbeY, involved in rRNA and/or ribosome maturation and assembly [Bathymodiolus heckerae thiotrophic gill symbiont]|uniref:rRNA maturation RNase YbeY n=1 Tax=Bathymodiolus heckerae thiotrophic gill symbiont TaxID=1052212 RepID=UPI0010B8E04F|nr:rRNA maturation RNase YbeY [Bathymodiolus heckerae thiotrophic gill symbiont]CAC9437784.1 Metal-dependent hydrolase YbeY, involved in rRNA and/or ribosome maturation and assembly [uncultured Gammaproteobacteria bacterium]SMN13468.1 Metal-dependent hydrolase YbeY, involved in rRNA and/or ribosome maturation and assembly [Bathymodiolus heckerae thiotrophic gill symbiont]SMN15086.1 Metal-dependent hydrolase YbeY, involved in rRNA and/or ribosome maturation and assembly [uncultured Candidatus Thi
MVVIQNPVNDSSINEQNLIDTLQSMITDLSLEASELLIRIVDIAEIQYLNKTYREQDKPTNVLSFPSDLPKEINAAILGDVVICSAVVRKEAEAQNKTFDHHLIHMAVHGTLHLLGYDHIEEGEAEAMEALEIKILHGLKICNPYQ